MRADRPRGLATAAVAERDAGALHLEAGRAKAERVFGLAKRYNAAVIVLTIDEQGMAKTAERKLEIARRIYHMAVDEFGLRPEDLVYDALTFTLATGDAEYSRSAIETLDGIRLIKTSLPGVLTSLGVSNVSFGLTPPARAVINSVMLFHAVQAGLDMAIVNPAQITPYAEIPAEERLLAEDLILNQRPDALARLVDHFLHQTRLQAKKSRQEIGGDHPPEHILPGITGKSSAQPLPDQAAEPQHQRHGFANHRQKPGDQRET